MSIMGAFQPDTSGDVYPSFLDVELALGTLSPGHIPCYVMEYPTGSDIGGEGAFTVPQNYAGSPVWVIKGVIDGTPASVLAFGLQQLSRDDSEAADTAYEAEDTASNSTWTGYADEDMYEETITITPSAAYQPGDTVFFYFYRDDSADTTTWNFLLTDLLFQYSDT
jgi:hypothetical protein